MAEIAKIVKAVLQHEFFEQRSPEIEVDTRTMQDVDLFLKVFGHEGGAPSEFHEIEVRGSAFHDVPEVVSRQTAVDHHCDTRHPWLGRPLWKLECCWIHCVSSVSVLCR